MSDAPPDNRRAALLLLAAAVAFTAEVIVVRALDGRAGDAQVMLSRGAAQLIALAPFVVAQGAATALTMRRPRLHLARGLISIVCWWLYYRSFRVLDMSLATTLTFSTSLFVVALAGPVMGETVGARRWVTTVIGFVGVAIAAGALTAQVDPGVAIGLGAALLGAVLVCLNRVLARSETTLAIMVWIGIITTVGSIPLAALDWRPLGAADVGLLLAAGVVGTAGMFLSIEAYRVGEVSALAPFPYARLPIAAAAAWLLWGEAPSVEVLVGGAVIIACALAATTGERRRGLVAPQR
jgi:drug/metabolite transporter (DMT)-like permease